jgi:hypothetical protein
MLQVLKVSRDTENLKDFEAKSATNLNAMSAEDKCPFSFIRAQSKCFFCLRAYVVRSESVADSGT